MADDITDDLRDVAYETDLCWRAAAEIERLRAALDAIDALHQPNQRIYCSACCDRWPCRTARLLHPEEADRG